MLECSPTNMERELRLGRRETGEFYPTEEVVVAIGIQLSRRGTVGSDNWFLRLPDSAVAAKIPPAG